VAGLVLNELGVPAVLDEVGDVGAAKRMQIQAFGQPEIIAVAPEPAQQGVLGDQRAPLAGEQIDAVVNIGLAVGQPVGNHLWCPIEDRQHGATLGR